MKLSSSIVNTAVEFLIGSFVNVDESAAAMDCLQPVFAAQTRKRELPGRAEVIQPLAARFGHGMKWNRTAKSIAIDRSPPTSWLRLC